MWTAQIDQSAHIYDLLSPPFRAARRHHPLRLSHSQSTCRSPKWSSASASASTRRPPPPRRRIRRRRCRRRPISRSAASGPVRIASGPPPVGAASPSRMLRPALRYRTGAMALNSRSSGLGILVACRADVMPSVCFFCVGRSCRGPGGSCAVAPRRHARKWGSAVCAAKADGAQVGRCGTARLLPRFFELTK